LVARIAEVWPLSVGIVNLLALGRNGSPERSRHEGRVLPDAGHSSCGTSDGDLSGQGPKRSMRE
jgi:hypothetical protein